jgi:hypothetical protein
VRFVAPNAKVRCTPPNTALYQNTIQKSDSKQSKVITSKNQRDTIGQVTMGIGPSVGDFLQRVDDDGLARLVEEVRGVFSSLLRVAGSGDWLSCGGWWL